MRKFYKIPVVFLVCCGLIFAADTKPEDKNSLEKQFPTNIEDLGLSDSPVVKETTKEEKKQKETNQSNSQNDKSGAIYVGGYSVDHEWNIVTEECLKILSTKKILYGSRSWGLVIGKYVASKKVINWEKAANKVSAKDMVLTADAFKDPKIINFGFDMEPKRWMYFDEFLRKEPWNFGKKIDGALQTLYYGGDRADMADSYFPVLDALVKDFPKVKFAIATHDIGADGTDLRGKVVKEESEWNIRGGDYSERVIKTYYGKLPIFDMRDIVSSRADGTVSSFQYKGKTYRKLCREYNSNNDLIHPNSPEAQARIGKGFLILLTKMYCGAKIPKNLNTPKPEILK